MRAFRYLALLIIIAACMSTPSWAEDNAQKSEDALKTALISGFAGLLSGLIASIITPAVQWRIEKGRYKLGYDRDIIRIARENLQPSFKSAEFLKTHTFYQLEPDFSPQIISRLRSSSGSAAEEEEIRLALFAEVARIERKWFR
jgi:hypothetical protein